MGAFILPIGLLYIHSLGTAHWEWWMKHSNNIFESWLAFGDVSTPSRFFYCVWLLVWEFNLCRLGSWVQDIVNGRGCVFCKFPSIQVSFSACGDWRGHWPHSDLYDELECGKGLLCAFNRVCHCWRFLGVCWVPRSNGRIWREDVCVCFPRREPMVSIRDCKRSQETEGPL